MDIMEIISGTTEFQIPVQTAVAVGKFDGIHIGHQTLLEDITKQKKHGLATCCFTFDPSPGIFFGFTEKGEITTKEEKRRLFAAYQEIDYLIEFPLNKESAAMDPMDFVTNILGEKLQTRFLAVGTDFTFGKGGEGNVAFLKAAAPKAGFQVSVLEKKCCQGQEISSSWVRETVSQGNMELAAQLLGMPYSILGHIVEGQHLGRTIGFPTINCLPDTGKLLPPNGVYFSEAVVGNGSVSVTYPAISNIGCKPTVSADGIIGIETHLLQAPHSINLMDAEYFSQEIMIRLLHYHRSECKFGSIEELKSQIADDVKSQEKWKMMQESQAPYR
jgi:riboflavin kinase/FMN adenylyltransferase